MSVRELLRTLPQIGRLAWIGVAAARRAPLTSLDEVEVTPEAGLVGDHHTGGTRRARQVTLIQHEHLATLASLVGRDVSPRELRRNLAVSGVNVLALKGRRFTIGDVELEGTGPCEPCSRMEENLGPGGTNAMRGHGGITARVVRGGRIRLGDEVRALVSDESSASDGA
jgi:MOSC domain-containing protein YiiM